MNYHTIGKYRNQLEQVLSGYFITNGGLGTSLIYHEKIELPCFASFYVLKDEAGCQWMKKYLLDFIQVAQKYGVGMVLESPTWRANHDWIRKIGYSDEDVSNINRQAIKLLSDIRNEAETKNSPIVINASVGPRGDGYFATTFMSPEEAQTYHTEQINVISQTDADMITAFTMNYPNEAIGIVRAAKEAGMPVAVSFTLEVDGKLATGQTLKEAIELVDEATQQAPLFYMVDCAHPANFMGTLVPEEAWVERIHGIKGNASRKSHAELDLCTELDSGDPVEFGECTRALLHKMKNLNILGGCCGTDYHHAEEICKACLQQFKQHPYSTGY